MNLDRFWSKVKKGKGCWEWQSTLRNGYGLFKICGVYKSAHRISFEIHKNKIPKGKIIMHKCDNRKCVNPSHLSIGTYLLNVRDMINKNRHSWGERHSMSKLTNQNVIDIIRLKKESNFSDRKLGKIFKIDHSIVNEIINKKRWKYV